VAAAKAAVAVPKKVEAAAKKAAVVVDAKDKQTVD
jgi:hypothetical protein